MTVSTDTTSLTIAQMQAMLKAALDEQSARLTDALTPVVEEINISQEMQTAASGRQWKRQTFTVNGFVVNVEVIHKKGTRPAR